MGQQRHRNQRRAKSRHAENQVGKHHDQRNKYQNLGVGHGCVAEEVAAAKERRV